MRQTKITHPQGALRIPDHNYIEFWSPSAPRFLSLLGVFLNESFFSVCVFVCVSVSVTHTHTHTVRIKYGDKA